ncbi:OmpA family protein [Fibrella aquatilis]|uniref:PD40 domain-containing protein n=1 Tax=Fibrella aquatilis TaxID=2817059 RepID=A0A939K1B8_9BACT|nr:OmpA family protein [Fibrella aquatilis]MBO0933353.1 PD40 domain-containing protein [Fibrella aquatilis]
MRFHTQFSLLILTVAVGLGGCNSAMQAYKKGVRHFEAGEYNMALGQFEKAGKGQIDPARLNYYTAESYRLSNRIAEAAPFYQKALDAGVGTVSAPDAATKAAGISDAAVTDLRLNYGYALKAQGNYPAALAQLQQYVDARPKNKVTLDKARREVETLKAIAAISAKQTDFRLKNLGGVNSAGTEYAPVLRGDELVFTASRKDVVYKNNGIPMTGLYKVKTGQTPDETGAGGPQLFSGNVFQGDVNEGTPAFSKDGKAMVFARGNNGKRKGGADVDLYLSRQDQSGNWGMPIRLPISDSLAWDGSPAFSADGRTLYFASNRAGSVGGIDLYRANMDASGRFGRPVNMGRDINTPGDEMFPFVAADGKLYFSSDGHPGLGKLDVFVATRSGGVIRIENMGQPINSPADDFGLTFPEANKGYMASNRAGGKGDDDIYLVESGQPDTTTIAKKDPPKPGTPGAPKVVRYFLAGSVATNTTPNNPLDSARVRIVDDANDATVAEVTTGQPGTFGKFPVQEGKTYSILAERRGYLTRREPFTMQGRSIPDIFLIKPETDTTFNVALLLDKVELNTKFVLENIYYDLDKYNIRADAAPELDKLVTILKDNPTLKIELSSHTDSRSPDAYNLRLSQNRAKAAVDYIVSKGIDADRLTAKGYGETQLVVKNARTEEEHQRNRRTEFKVLAL